MLVRFVDQSRRSKACSQRTGLCDVGGFEKRQARNRCRLKNKCTRYQPKAHRCLSCPNNCCYVARDEDYNVMPQYCKTPCCKQPYFFLPLLIFLCLLGFVILLRTGIIAVLWSFDLIKKASFDALSPDSIRLTISVSFVKSFIKYFSFS